MNSWSHTDVGKVRTNNEDSYRNDDSLGIYILADGMGGHNGGEVASRLAVDTAYDFIHEQIVGRPEGITGGEILEGSLTAAHETIQKKAEEDDKLSGMGTTLVEVLIRGEKAFVCHAGDSRAYRFRGELSRLTSDHTLGEYLVERQIMPRDQVPPQQWHILIQAVGANTPPVPDVDETDVAGGDLFLLCSDGLTDMVSDVEIAEIMREFQHDGDRIAKALVERANEKGGRDNITVTLIRVE